jgi:hypothetical protein
VIVDKRQMSDCLAFINILDLSIPDKSYSRNSFGTKFDIYDFISAISLRENVTCNEEMMMSALYQTKHDKLDLYNTIQLSFTWHYCSI